MIGRGLGEEPLHRDCQAAKALGIRFGDVGKDTGEGVLQRPEGAVGESLMRRFTPMGQ